MLWSQRGEVWYSALTLSSFVLIIFMHALKHRYFISSLLPVSLVLKLSFVSVLSVLSFCAIRTLLAKDAC